MKVMVSLEFDEKSLSHGNVDNREFIYKSLLMILDNVLKVKSSVLLSIDAYTPEDWLAGKDKENA
jgi:hypothetical protein